MSSYGIGWLTVVNLVRSSDSPFCCLLLYIHIPIQGPDPASPVAPCITPSPSTQNTTQTDLSQ